MFILRVRGCRRALAQLNLPPNFKSRIMGFLGANSRKRKKQRGPVKGHRGITGLIEGSSMIASSSLVYSRQTLTVDKPLRSEPLISLKEGLLMTI